MAKNMNLLLAPITAPLLVGVGVGIAFQPALGESASFWAILISAYLPLGAWALLRAKRQGRLPKLVPRFGDLTIGIVLGLALVACGMLVLSVAAPAGSPNQSWLFRVYAHVGDIQRSPWLIAGLCALALLEELTWRELVLDSLAQQIGRRLAAPFSAILYSLSHIPTLWLLADTTAGLNPLLVMGALGAGIVWGFLTFALNRLPPVVLSHIVFSYFLSAPLPKLL